MASPVLKLVAGNTYIIQTPVIMGVYVRDNRAILIDSGNDREAGRQVLKIMNILKSESLQRTSIRMQPSPSLMDVWNKRKHTLILMRLG